VLGTGWFHRDPRVRRLAQYGLASLGLFAVGLLLFAWRATPALGYYWFRFGDTIVPLISWLALAAMLDPIVQGWHRWLRAALAAGSTAVLASTLLWAAQVYAALRGAGIFTTVPPLTRTAQESSEGRAAMLWIRSNTPRNARFLIAPDLEQFYAVAERAVWVTWKHFPQTPADIVEWFSRMRRVNAFYPGRMRRYLGPPEQSATADDFAGDVEYALIPADPAAPALYRDQDWMVVPVTRDSRLGGPSSSVGPVQHAIVP
jgi:hypothetical protein